MGDNNELRLRIARLEGRQRMAIGMGAAGIVIGTLSLAWTRPWSAADDLTLRHLRVAGPEGTIEIRPTQLIATSRSGGQASLGVSDAGADLEIGGGDRGFAVHTKAASANLLLGDTDGANVTLQTSGSGASGRVDGDFAVYGSASTSIAIDPGAPHVSISNGTYHVDLVPGESPLRADGNGRTVAIDLK